MAKKQDLSAKIDESGGYLVECGDCRDVMRLMEPESVDSIVSDPPYGIDFMGKGWDHGVPSVEFWKEALRVAKPGAYLLAFGGTRTFHRLAVAIEDSGWEIRDTIMWVYGSGFPKSHNIGKAIDKIEGNEREVVGEKKRGDVQKAKDKGVGYLADFANRNNVKQFGYGTETLTKGNSEWEGWGTALKPAWEPIIVARKPIIGTVAENVLKHGTGGMNIDACRVEGEPTSGSGANMSNDVYGKYQDVKVGKPNVVNVQGRFPANLIHDGSDEVVAGFPHLHGNKSDVGTGVDAGSYEISYSGIANRDYGSKGGSAARFFYCAKANQTDRNEGLDEIPIFEGKRTHSGGLDTRGRPIPKNKNIHPTVKPTDLMRYLCRLVTQPNGIVLDPFMGSGSTGKAAVLEGFRFMGIDLNEEYCTIAKSRIKSANPKLETPMVENNPKNEGMLF